MPNLKTKDQFSFFSKIREYAKALKADELSELQKTYIKKQEANEALSKKEKE